MADTIKIGNLDISAFKVGSGDCKVYLGDTLLYPQTQPTFQGKWLATYSDSSTSSAECDSSSAITNGEITIEALISVEIGDCVTSIDNDVFAYSGLKTITIPNTVTSIGVGAFYSCGELTNVTIGSGVTSIGNYTFYSCGELTNVTIGSGVTSIGMYAFYSCIFLTSINIPSGVTSIGDGAFSDCISLTSITVNATTPPILGSNAFYNTNDCPIYVPSGSVSAYQSASDWSEYASRIQPIPNS